MTEIASTVPQIARFRKVGNVTYFYGHVAVEADGQPFQGPFLDEARRVFACVAESLSAAGATMADVVSVRAYLTDLADFADFNQVWGETFTSNPPVRTTVQAGLIEPFRIELEIVASV
ncbi:RidA family protein [Diaminobutyricibacter sp. McL0618]|uniref:RidA family protein n=1 Tax=Leifsonia sp. McL0618 TaxID=3415677 RepID=UPI003CE78269